MADRRAGPSLRRDHLLIAEMTDAAEQAQLLAAGADMERLENDRQRRDALLGNFTVLGEANIPKCPGVALPLCGTASSTATGRSTSPFSTPPRTSSSAS
ncbi:hypothetical protein HNR02_000962 [Amycolatopsis endophytica]|uniref:Uncharacterized protein n=1 Tax=Amycolatopsis endophytica TaxID=860233 RepID=A0A853AYC7_9PSEU|nr:hypothetical protein [Amycolatopsis endophytica]NYI87639.1 hypothetical protein [Amycolatopsis endophytica]